MIKILIGNETYVLSFNHVATGKRVRKPKTTCTIKKQTAEGQSFLDMELISVGEVFKCEHDVNNPEYARKTSLLKAVNSLPRNARVAIIDSWKARESRPSQSLIVSKITTTDAAEIVKKITALLTQNPTIEFNLSLTPTGSSKRLRF